MVVAEVVVEAGNKKRVRVYYIILRLLIRVPCGVIITRFLTISFSGIDS